MAKGLFSFSPSTVAMQSPPPFPPVPPCLALLPLWGSLKEKPSGLSILITPLQAGVSHTVNDASWEIQVTCWLTLFSSKTP